VFLSAHAVACALEGRNWREPPPSEAAERRRWWALRLAPLLMCITSIGTDLSRSQVDLVMLAAFAFAIYLATRGREIGAGAFLSFPAAVKLFPALLLVYPLWRRKWRMLAGGVIGLAMSLVLLPAVVLGPERTVTLYGSWAHVILKPGLGHGTDTSRADELTSLTKTDNQSLLAFIHNWSYHNLPRSQRPSDATPGARHATYAIGALMLLGIGLMSGVRRRDSARDLLILTGLLMGTALVITPVAHNYYYLLLLPLLTALFEYGLSDAGLRGRIWLASVMSFFMLTDILARMPGIGPWLRDWGVPLLSLVAMLVTGAIVLLKSPAAPASPPRLLATEPQPVAASFGRS